MKETLRVAIVEDSQMVAEVLRSVIKHELLVDIRIYPSGEDLLKVMESGTRFDLYILDYQLDRFHNKLWGDEIAKEILFTDRGAKIIGMSSETYKSLFTSLGVEFVVKASIKEKILRLIKKLLSAQLHP